VFIDVVAKGISQLEIDTTTGNVEDPNLPQVNRP
jgi:hypothetical protein